MENSRHFVYKRTWRTAPPVKIGNKETDLQITNAFTYVHIFNHM